MKKREQKEGSNVEVVMANATRWAVSYGDLMSVLMILFLLLYSFQSMAGIEGAKMLDRLQQVFGGKADLKLANMIRQLNLEEETAKEIRGFIAGASLEGYAVIKVDDFQIKIMLTQAIMFDPGSTSLSPRIYPVLNMLVEMVQRIDNAIQIEGHSDNTPGNNFEISSLRALAVLNYFKLHGVDPKRLSTLSYGENRPVVDNSTPENRNRNRRVEINIIRKHSNLIKNI